VHDYKKTPHFSGDKFGRKKERKKKVLNSGKYST
jgi:hypothetical protein